MTFVSDVLNGAYVGKDPLFTERVLIAEDRHDEAISSLAGKIRQHPKWPEPWAVLGLAFSLAGRFDEALTAVEQALAMEPGHAFAQELKTGLLLHLGLNDSAVQSAERLAEMLPERAESHAFVAFAHAFAGNEDEAVEAASRSRSLAPNRAIGHQALCVTSLAFNRWSSAEQHALMALALDKPSASVFHDLGVALDAQGKHENAAQAFAAAAQLDARFADVSREAPTYHRGPSVAAALSATLVSGLALLTVARSPIAFMMVSIVGVVSLVVALRSAARHTPTWGEAVQPVLWGVLFAGVFFAARSMGFVA